MKRIIILGALFVLAALPGFTQAPTSVPTEAFTGRIHLVRFTGPAGEVTLPVMTRGAEPIVAAEPPHPLNMKSALIIPTRENFALFQKGFESTNPVEVDGISGSSIPNMPPNVAIKALSGQTPIRTIVRPCSDHGTLKFPHYDFVTFYPLPQ